MVILVGMFGHEDAIGTRNIGTRYRYPAASVWLVDLPMKAEMVEGLRVLHSRARCSCLSGSGHD